MAFRRFSSFPLHTWVVALALVLGLAVRLYDLTDPPLDFHPMRQLKGAITARYLYYRWNPRATPEEKEWAAKLHRRLLQMEPPVLDALVAGTYLLLGREALWVGRVYASLFWVLGALGVYVLARRWMPPWPALAGSMYMLFHPFAILAGRAFQPDPLMVMLLTWSVYAWVRWAEAEARRLEPASSRPAQGRASRATRWAVAAALLSMATVLVKGFAFFFLMAVGPSVALSRIAPKTLWRNRRFWAALVPMVLALVGFYGLYRHFIVSYTGQWTFSLLSLVASPVFYAHWAHTVIKWLGGGWLLGATLGYALTARKPFLAVGWGWALGYGAYALSVPYQTMTHNYYHLPLMPWMALGLAGLAAVLYGPLLERPGWARLLAVLAVLGAGVYGSAAALREMHMKDYRAEPAFWQNLVAQLPPGRYIGLLQDFGLRMNYFGGRAMDVWPSTGVLELRRLRTGTDTDVWELFQERTQGYDYFLVTAMGQWEQQEELREILTRHYPVVLQGEGFIVFDLRHPKP